MAAWDAPTTLTSSADSSPLAIGVSEETELVGPHLRVKGTIALGMFHRCPTA